MSPQRHKVLRLFAFGLLIACAGGCDKRPHAPEHPSAPAPTDQTLQPGQGALKHPAIDAIYGLFDAAQKRDLPRFKTYFTAESRKFLEDMFARAAALKSKHAVSWPDLMALHRELDRPRVLAISGKKPRVVLTLHQGKVRSQVTLRFEDGRWRVSLTEHQNFDALKRTIDKFGQR